MLILIAFDFNQGKFSFDKSVSVIFARTDRDLGPIIPSTPFSKETFLISTSSSFNLFWFSQSKSLISETAADNA